jgi:D-proline reductase (dithiol) PrdB
VGLVQRVIEARGIATVSISQVRAITERVRPPRALFLRWPFGHALGEPGNVLQHRRILWEMFRDLRDRPPEERGSVRDLTLRWRRETYGPVDFHALDRSREGT